MKIAVCISGNLNHWLNKYSMWNNLFYKILNSSKYFNTNCSFDIFVHTWDFNINSANDVKTIDNSILLDFQNFVRPKDIKIENFEKYISRADTLNELKYQHSGNTHNNSLLLNCAPDFYSMMMSSHIKRQYELKHHFEYDVCFRLSTDVTITDDIINVILDRFTIPNDKVVYPANVIKTFQFPYDVVNFDLFFANSQTFDVLCSIYNMLPLLKTEQFPKDISSQYMFGYFLRMFDMKIHRLNILYDKKVNFV
jgi:hypothetical protein